MTEQIVIADEGRDIRSRTRLAVANRDGLYRHLRIHRCGEQAWVEIAWDIFKTDTLKGLKSPKYHTKRRLEEDNRVYIENPV